MCALSFAALLGLAAGCGSGAPTSVLAPANPRLDTRYRPPPSPLAGLKRYKPVEARNDWGSTPPAASTQPGGMGAMPGMNGMSMPGMDMGKTR